MKDPDRAPGDRPESHPPRWRRWLKRAFGCVLLGFLIVGVGLWYLTRDYVRTLSSLERVPGTQLYVMDYYADYNLEQIREEGMDVERVEESLLAVMLPDVVLPVARKVKQWYMPEPTYQPVEAAHRCSTAVLDTADGQVLFGRNFDWHGNACLLLRIYKPDGISSVAVIDLQYLNLNRSDLEHSGLVERVPLLFAPYYVMDGMNEHGVAVSDMAVRDVEPPYREGRPELLHSTAMRLILDEARSTQEALALLDRYNIRFAETSCHLMIADRQGDRAVVEFIGGELHTVRTNEDWQVSTNHRLWGRSETENDAECSRYRTLSDRLDSGNALLDLDAFTEVIGAAAVQDWTMWTSVYNLSTGEFSVAHRQRFDQAYAGQLPLHPHRPASRRAAWSPEDASHQTEAGPVAGQVDSR